MIKILWCSSGQLGVTAPNGCAAGHTVKAAAGQSPAQQCTHPRAEQSTHSLSELVDEISIPAVAYLAIM